MENSSIMALALALCNVKAGRQGDGDITSPSASYDRKPASFAYDMATGFTGMIRGAQCPLYSCTSHG